MIVLRDSKEEQAAFWKTLKANLFKGTDASFQNFPITSKALGLIFANIDAP